MKTREIVKGAARGTDDYHYLMRAIVFTILPQRAQLPQVADFPEYIWEHAIEAQFGVHNYQGDLIAAHRLITTNLCHRCCKYAYWATQRIWKLTKYRWVVYARYTFTYQGDPHIVYTCPLCGKEFFPDDIPF